jgi:replication-associated recombination protein RarA
MKPLAEELRPKSLDEFYSQKQTIVGEMVPRAFVRRRYEAV